MPKLSPYYAILVLLIATAGAQEKSRFEPRPATSYPARQTTEGVTIAVEPYETSEKIKEAFGKAELSRFGILPILVVIANDSDRVLQLERMRVQFITADRQIVDPTPPEDVLRPTSVKPSDVVRQPRPRLPGIGRGQPKPRVDPEVLARAFVAPVVPAGGRAYGFFYFRVAKGAERMPGSKLYITGLRDARTAQELVYFEISLDPYLRGR